MATDVQPQLALEAPESPEGRRLKVVLGGAVVLLAIATVWSVPRPTGDLYVALAAGRDIMHGKLGAADDWAFTTRGRVWVNQNWGTHMLYYFFYRATGGRDGHLSGDEGSGEIGLLILKFLILLVGTVSLVYACRWRGAGWPVALLVSGGVIAAGRSFIDLRPNLTTLMFVPVMLHLLYRTEDRPRRIWLVMVVFGVIWANLHGGFILGLGAMGFWAACMVLGELLRHRSLRKLLAGLAWGAGVALLVWMVVQQTFLQGRSVLCAAGAFLLVAGAYAAVVARGMAKAAGAHATRAQLREALVGTLRGRWQYIAATLGAIVLAGVATPFGVHQAFRDYSALKMKFWEIWNLSHPFVVMASEDKELWQSVIEWHSIFTASATTFGTSWEFFSIVGLLCGLVSLHVLVKLLRGRSVTLEDLVLLAGIVVLTIVVFVRARPVYREFRHIVDYFRRPGREAQLAEVSEQLWGWIAAMIVYPLLGLFALSMLLAAAASIVTRRETLQRITSRQVRAMVFDVAMAAGGIFYFAFDARRFIPLSLILLAPLLARRLQWLLSALAELWPRIWSWALAAVLAGLCAWGLVASAARDKDWVLLWGLLAMPIVLVAAQYGLRVLGELARPALAWRAWPMALAAAALLTLIGVQAYDNALRYWPTSPRVRYRSVLKNMIVYSQFSPNCRDFINDNRLAGRVFNEWRWEGYLRWYCPQLQTFLGGRAQQAYDADTYRLQRRLLGEGAEPPSVLTEMNVPWTVVPMNASFGRFLQATVYDSAAQWAPIFCDGENLVLANLALPEGRRAVEQCLQGQLKYREPAFAGLSRGYCLTAMPVARMLLAGAPQAADPKAAREQLTRQAIAAMKESHKHRPILSAYTALSDLYRGLPINPAEEIAHWEAEHKRLKAMNYRRLGGVEILQCRQWVLDMLMDLYQLTKQDDQAQRIRGEIELLTGQIRAVLERWR